MRFQGGTIFPIAIALVLVLGIALIVYARQTQPDASEYQPNSNDHWHAAYGFNVCGTWYQLEGALEERSANGGFANANFQRTGVHSHSDGVIHWHPYGSAAIGSNAVLGVFLENYEVELDDDRLKFPDAGIVLDQNGAPLGAGEMEFEEGDYKCGDEDAEVTMRVWDDYTMLDSEGQNYATSFNDVRIDEDGMVFSIYVQPTDSERAKPPWTPRLPELGAADQPAEERRLQSPGSTLPTGTAVDGTGPAGTAPDGTVPAGTTADGTGPAGTAPAEEAPSSAAPATTAVATPPSEVPEPTDG